MQAKWQQNATCTLFAQVNAGFTANTNEKTVDSFRDNGFYLVVEYSTTQNAHPVGVRRAVLKTHPSEEYGVHPRIYSNHLAG